MLFLSFIYLFSVFSFNSSAEIFMLSPFKFFLSILIPTVFFLAYNYQKSKMKYVLGCVFLTFILTDFIHFYGFKEVFQRLIVISFNQLFVEKIYPEEGLSTTIFVFYSEFFNDIFYTTCIFIQLYLRHLLQ